MNFLRINGIAVQQRSRRQPWHMPNGPVFWSNVFQE